MIRQELQRRRVQRSSMIFEIAEIDRMPCDHEKKVITNETVQRHMAKFKSLHDKVWGHRVCNTAAVSPNSSLPCSPEQSPGR